MDPLTIEELSSPPTPIRGPAPPGGVRGPGNR